MDEASRIRAAWRANAGAWTRAVREGHIGTRVRVTDAAVLDAVMARQPRRVIDLGCGEGWLVRALADRGVDALGVDAEPALIEAARATGGGRFETLDYAAIAAGRLDQRADVVVANFALLGGEGTASLLRAASALAAPAGALIVQTVHPWSAGGTGTYADGWREESWKGFGVAFDTPSPWYFRTLESWMALFAAADLHVRRLREPIDPATGRPASLLIELEAETPFEKKVASR